MAVTIPYVIPADEPGAVAERLEELSNQTARIAGALEALLEVQKTLLLVEKLGPDGYREKEEAALGAVAWAQEERRKRVQEMRAMKDAIRDLAKVPAACGHTLDILRSEFESLCAFHGISAAELEVDP